MFTLVAILYITECPSLYRSVSCLGLMLLFILPERLRLFEVSKKTEITNIFTFEKYFRTASIVNYLMVYTVNTGLLTRYIHK